MSVTAARLLTYVCYSVEVRPPLQSTFDGMWIQHTQWLQVLFSTGTGTGIMSLVHILVHNCSSCHNCRMLPSEEKGSLLQFHSSHKMTPDLSLYLWNATIYSITTG